MQYNIIISKRNIQGRNHAFKILDVRLRLTMMKVSSFLGIIGYLDIRVTRFNFNSPGEHLMASIICIAIQSIFHIT